MMYMFNYASTIGFEGMLLFAGWLYLCINAMTMLLDGARFAPHAEILKSDRSRDQIDAIYDSYMERSDQISKRYFREVDRGTNARELKKWNAIVLEALEIDNLSLFGLDQ